MVVDGWLDDSNHTGDTQALRRGDDGVGVATEHAQPQLVVRLADESPGGRQLMLLIHQWQHLVRPAVYGRGISCSSAGGCDECSDVESDVGVDGDGCLDLGSCQSPRDEAAEIVEVELHRSRAVDHPPRSVGSAPSTMTPSLLLFTPTINDPPSGPADGRP